MNMWGTCSRRVGRIANTMSAMTANATAATHAMTATHAMRTQGLRGYASSEFGTYDNPPNYETGEMGGDVPKKERRPRAYARTIVRDKPSVLTQSDRDKLEFRKKVREGKNLEQYNTTIAEFIDREDSYEALVTLMDMYSNNVQPDVETFNILIFGHFKLNLPHKAVDVFLDMAPAEMKQDSLVFDRLVSELVKAKQYPLIGRLKFLADPDPLGRKQVAQVNITEMAVKWARYWFPEMGESEIQRIYGNQQYAKSQASSEWESTSKFGKAAVHSTTTTTTTTMTTTTLSQQKEDKQHMQTKQSYDQTEYDVEEETKGKDDIEGASTADTEADTEADTTERAGDEDTQKDPAVELKERLAKARLDKAEKKAMERKQRIKAILEKNRNKNKDKI